MDAFAKTALAEEGWIDMRLSLDEKQAILDTILKFDPEAEIYLFGSRTDSSKKGGDIDLLILSKKLSEDYKRLIRNDICDIIGEQKIDVLIAENESSPFVRKAKRNGIKLND
ncbi:MAG TPA: nucleotidyltransferase domain-containing protein [Pseudobdellovibrionaceae bacterium]